MDLKNKAPLMTLQWHSPGDLDETRSRKREESVGCAEMKTKCITVLRRSFSANRKSIGYGTGSGKVVSFPQQVKDKRGKCP